MSAGFESRAAFAREAQVYGLQWPAVADPVATLLLPLLSESVNQRSEYQALAKQGQGTTSRPKLTGRFIQGEVVVDLYYEGLEFLWAAALGYQARRINGTLMPEAVVAGAYRHLFEVDRSLHLEGWQAGDGFIAGTDNLISGQKKVRRGSYMISKALDLWRGRSCMVEGLQLAFQPGGAQANVSLIGWDFIRTIGDTALNALTCPVPRILNQETRFYLAPLANAPLGTSATEIVEITGVSVTLRNALRAHTNVLDGVHIGEPRRGGPATVEGAFSLPTYSAANFLLRDYEVNDVELCALIESTGSIIVGSTPYRFRVWLPSLKVTATDVVVSGPGMVQQAYSFAAGKPESTPAGFPVNIKAGPLMIETVGTVSQHPLI
jgi:hypothetical protein